MEKREKMLTLIRKDFNAKTGEKERRVNEGRSIEGKKEGGRRSKARKINKEGELFIKFIEQMG